jgi:hypothetical protein
VAQGVGTKFKPWYSKKKKKKKREREKSKGKGVTFSIDNKRHILRVSGLQEGIFSL